MPSNQDAPTFALLSEVDARAWSGTVMDIIAGAGGQVNIPTSQEYWEDSISFLCGRGSAAGRDMDADLVTQGGANWNIYIDVDDLVTIDFPTAFSLTTGFGEEAFGFTVGGGPYNSVAIVGGHQLKAPDDWVRGLTTGRHLRIVEGANTYNVPSVGYQAQDVVTLFRASSLTDVDAGDALNNLEAQINTVGDPIDKRFRLGIDNEGFMFFAWSNAGPANFDADAFSNDDFQRFLGFDGSETAIFYAIGFLGVWILKASYRCAGAIIPSRPIRNSYPRFEEETNTVALTSGEIASNKVMDWSSLVVEWILDGPQDSIDLSTHYLNEFVPRNQKGMRLAYYPVWGDPRRARFDADVRIDLSGTTPPYDLVGTSELDGYRGRFRGSRDLGDPIKKSLKYPGRLRRRLPMTTFLRGRLD